MMRFLRVVSEVILAVGLMIATTIGILLIALLLAAWLWKTR